MWTEQSDLSRNFLPFPKGQFLDASKLKEFADDNFKFDENGRQFSNCVENTVGKGEIACYEFLKDLYCRHVKTRACLGKGLAITQFSACQRTIIHHKSLGLSKLKVHSGLTNTI